MAIDRATWKQQTLGHEELFLKLSEHLPKELIFGRGLLVCGL
jgi:phosphoenolpyruvate carboxykinase (GTP)